ncbi:hypothetical protein D1631_03060 [Chryseobacterium nematophagum]|uniref:Uncharacterized protein n=1 Tax=Chryseobacterium nematophagum TaxID=2305228 RepID=A0A3M7TBT0_9FLAO|nr:hypothetical protein [Chryseobacterium nematophagum]RNA60982.1 hypothetical protein D1631_03060 [Chryseobacterium nematophagum]
MKKFILASFSISSLISLFIFSDHKNHPHTAHLHLEQIESILCALVTTLVVAGTGWMAHLKIRR